MKQAVIVGVLALILGIALYVSSGPSPVEDQMGSGVTQSFRVHTATLDGSAGGLPIEASTIRYDYAAPFARSGLTIVPQQPLGIVAAKCTSMVRVSVQRSEWPSPGAATSLLDVTVTSEGHASPAVLLVYGDAARLVATRETGPDGEASIFFIPRVGETYRVEAYPKDPTKCAGQARAAPESGGPTTVDVPLPGTVHIPVSVEIQPTMRNLVGTINVHASFRLLTAAGGMHERNDEVSRSVLAEQPFDLGTIFQDVPARELVGENTVHVLLVAEGADAGGRDSSERILVDVVKHFDTTGHMRVELRPAKVDWRGTDKAGADLQLSVEKVPTLEG